MIKRFGDGRDWFFEKKLGLFIHWGLYAIPAWQEQILWRSNYRRGDYERLMGQFNPQRFNPDAWIDMMQEAGMEFLCFTTKHHDGFCMWDTKYTDYKVTNTPYGRDVLEQVVEACRRRGILVGLYYSLPDWHHPNYPNRGRHHEMAGPRPGDEPDEEAYLDYVRNQLRELLTGYGEVCELFWDVNVAEFFDPELNDQLRRLQPTMVINDRGPGPGDFSTPERQIPAERVFSHPVQACQSVGRESWGFRRDEDYFTSRYLAQSIDSILAMGGSYLLNVGPTADGELPREAVDRLRRVGEWYRRVAPSFEGSYPASYLLGDAQTMRIRYDEVLLTRRENTLFVHCPGHLQTNTVVLPGVELPVTRARLLNDGRDLAVGIEELPWRWTERPCVVVRGIPVEESQDEVFVIELMIGDSAST